MNGAFVVFGLTVAFGAVLLLMQRGRSRMLALACWLWIISGISTAAAGVVPLDVDLELHALVSAPAILLQPIALALHAWVYAREDRRWFGLVIAACAIALVAVFFLLRLEVQGGGIFERLAIWPVLLALPVLAVHHLRTARQSWVHGGVVHGGGCEVWSGV